MIYEKENLKESLKVQQNIETTSISKVPEGYDMQSYPVIALIDDDSNLVKDLKKELPSVIFKKIDIETIIRNISRRTEDRSIKNADLIFIDTLYKDEESDAYAIDFFEMYMNMSSELFHNTVNKYKVLIGIDDIKQMININSKRIETINERTKISSLLGKARRHPYIEWGLTKGSKTEAIVNEIEKYAENEKIYLYKSPEMSLEEWIEYIKSLTNKVNNLIEEVQSENLMYSGKMRLNSIINDYRYEVSKVNEILGLDGKNGENRINSIRSALECTKSFYKGICVQTQNLMKLGNDENNTKLRNSSHHFLNSILSVQYMIFKTEKKINSEREQV